MTSPSLPKPTDLPAFEELSKLWAETTFMSIAGKQSSETIHSALIGWIFSNPDFNQLINSPISKLIKLIAKKGNDKILEFCNEDTIEDIYYATEKLLHNGRIDILLNVILSSHKQVRIWIENKIHSKVGRNQLERYYNSIVNLSANHKIYNVYLFLSTDCNNGSRHDKFINITYQELYDEILLELLDEAKLAGDRSSIIYLQEYLKSLTSVDEMCTPIVKSEIYLNILKDIYDARKKYDFRDYPEVLKSAISEFGSLSEKELIKKNTHSFTITLEGKSKTVSGYTDLAVMIFRYLIKKYPADELVLKCGRIKHSKLSGFDNCICDVSESKGASSRYSKKHIGNPRLYVSNQWCYQKIQYFIRHITAIYPEIKIEQQ